MKKLLLIAITFLSMNTFAQDLNQQIYYTIGGGQSNVYKIFPDSINPYGNATPILDSIYFWKWDTISNVWNYDLREIHVINSSC